MVIRYEILVKVKPFSNKIAKKVNIKGIHHCVVQSNLYK